MSEEIFIYPGYTNKNKISGKPETINLSNKQLSNINKTNNGKVLIVIGGRDSVTIKNKNKVENFLREVWQIVKNWFSNKSKKVDQTTLDFGKNLATGIQAIQEMSDSNSQTIREQQELGIDRGLKNLKKEERKTPEGVSGFGERILQ